MNMTLSNLYQCENILPAVNYLRFAPVIHGHDVKLLGQTNSLLQNVISLLSPCLIL